MFIACDHPEHAFNEATGQHICPDPQCLIVAVSHHADPMQRMPEVRPDWILASPDWLDAREVEALAVLGDAGLVPQVVAPDDADCDTDYFPAAVRQHLRAV